MPKRQRIEPLFIAVKPVSSKFAKTIQQALREKVVNSIYRVRPGKGRVTFTITQRVLNKVEQYERFQSSGVSCPRFATSIEGAKGIECKTLFARLLINSTNGRGIVEFESNSAAYPRAPCYTEYIPKKSEYRFHVFNGEVIDIQQKKKKFDHVGERNTRIRNLGNGYVYCRDGVSVPDSTCQLAVSAVQACGYFYGAVDIIYNEKRDTYYVLEVNSRPGLTGTTLGKYTEALINCYNLVRKE